MRIAIVGAGIGGLLTAIALQQRGLAAQVYDRAAELREIGAGLIIGSNAVRLLWCLGLGERFERVSFVQEAEGPLRRWQNGAVVAEKPIGRAAVRRYGYATHGVCRADLQRLLLDALPPDRVHPGLRCEGLRDDGREAEVDLVDRSGGRHRVRADVVIGADGLHSAVAARMHGEANRLNQAGQRAFRFLVPARRAPEFARHSYTAWLGPGRHLVHYPIRRGEVVNFMAWLPGERDDPRPPGAPVHARTLHAEFTGWHEDVHDLLAAAGDGSCWPIFHKDPLPGWTAGRVALLGDAAHSMLPFLGQGVGQTAEDAVVLARCLAEGHVADVPAALRRYEALRIDRATDVQLRSRERCYEFHLPDGPEQRARDAAYPLEVRQEADLLYGHDPLGDPP
ncbi:FAD-dependent monooxygenase [Saccharothrix australiensis]|uniref:Salicylate hydroxylase n=1 Tax=Saccharothrix australiensis TaxID=2072 RepID=A0A495W6Y6_9PSEU|nr:FAD-dependent monooxygenase [Saccharothrix australiensis]RKT55568.1 salicylate hydroxylase [Saccharothrix australiensis]